MRTKTGADTAAGRVLSHAGKRGQGWWAFVIVALPPALAHAYKQPCRHRNIVPIPFPLPSPPLPHPPHRHHLDSTVPRPPSPSHQPAPVHCIGGKQRNRNHVLDR